MVIFRKYRILADLQDLEDNRKVTLKEGKDFLGRLWEDYHEDDWESLEDYEAFLDKIYNCNNWKELDEMLQGCDYTIFKNIKELEYYRR